MGAILNFPGWMRLNEQQQQELGASYTKFPADVPKEKATQIVDFLKRNGTSTGGWIVLDEDKEHIYKLDGTHMKGEGIMSSGQKQGFIDELRITRYKIYTFSDKESSWLVSQVRLQDNYRFLSKMGANIGGGNPIDEFNVVGVWGGSAFGPEGSKPDGKNKYGLVTPFLEEENKEFAATIFKGLGGTTLEHFKKQLTAIAEGNIPSDSLLKEDRYKKRAKYILDQLG